MGDTASQKREQVRRDGIGAVIGSADVQGCKGRRLPLLVAETSSIPIARSSPFHEKEIRCRPQHRTSDDTNVAQGGDERRVPTVAKKAPWYAGSTSQPSDNWPKGGEALPSGHPLSSVHYERPTVNISGYQDSSISTDMKMNVDEYWTSYDCGVDSNSNDGEWYGNAKEKEEPLGVTRNVSYTSLGMKRGLYVPEFSTPYFRTGKKIDLKPANEGHKWGRGVVLGTGRYT
ncbi:hypothetical protein PENTCL1PPCAC_27169 [Pristionchus entomophagus]|uniref:Uncharacterized protein n=1 Tax=Pristionchus entomophagus TaxID=358040 RepID=A0AAV5UG40_9BILA|nr:hypothetical protein PENTCL1PPCAC_27169 [Pristionchus entomophagus]